MKNEKPVLAIIIFSDISGFGGFWRRVNYPDTELHPFRDAWRNAVRDFRRDTGYFVKRLGDGIMAIKEIDENLAQAAIAEALNKAWAFTNCVLRIIKKKRSPRPDGFRTRMSCGYVWRDSDAELGDDYLGDAINLTEKMMHLHVDNPFVCHETIRDRLTPRSIERNRFRFGKLITIPRASTSIYDQDMNALYEFKKR